MHTGHSPEKTSRTSIALDILFVELTTNLPPKTPRKTMEPPTNKSPSIWVPLGSRSSSSLIDSPPDKFKQKFSDGRSCNYGGCGVFFLCVPGAFLGEKHGKTLQVISNLCVLFVVGIIRLQNHKYKTTNKTLRSLSEFKPFIGPVLKLPTLEKKQTAPQSRQGNSMKIIFQSQCFLDLGHFV